MRLTAIDAVIADLRSVHPELQDPLTWTAMSAILAREGIVLITIPLLHDAQVISCDGISVIAINSNAPVARHTYYAAHEYGHIKLHFQEHGEVVYHSTACWPEDPREDDAEYFATTLLMGPQRLAVSAASSYPDVETVNRVGDDAPIVGPRRRKAPLPNGQVAQGSLPLPPDAPLPHQPRPRKTSPEDSIVALLRRNSPKLDARLRARDRAAEQTLDLRPRVEFEAEGRKHYFVDSEGGRWRIHDMMQPGRKSKSTREYAIEPPNNWAEARVFVRSDGTRRRYAFTFAESHELNPAMLERQLQRTTVMPTL